MRVITQMKRAVSFEEVLVGFPVVGRSRRDSVVEIPIASRLYR